MPRPGNQNTVPQLSVAPPAPSLLCRTAAAVALQAAARRCLAQGTLLHSLYAVCWMQRAARRQLARSAASSLWLLRGLREENCCRVLPCTLAGFLLPCRSPALPALPFEDAPEAALREQRWGWPHKWLSAAASGAAEPGRSTSWLQAQLAPSYEPMVHGVGCRNCVGRPQVARVAH